MRRLHLLLLRQLHLTVHQGKIVLLCATLLQAVLTRKLLADLRKPCNGLRADHDARGLLVQAVAAAALGARAVCASATVAADELLALFPPLARAHCCLVLELERQVLVDLDLGLFTVEQHGCTLHTGQGRRRQVVFASTIGASVVARLVDAEDLVGLAQQLGWEPARPHLACQHVKAVVVNDLCRLLLQHVLHTRRVVLLRPEFVKVDELLQHALRRLPGIAPFRVVLVRLDRRPHRPCSAPDEA
mmetsp:Transcript_47620/g.110306  ORF Transcript_47620/g.110306 Transcript_47620/m.110306 type:complete len:245 (+) Transcript_47620:1292-2026(+)